MFDRFTFANESIVFIDGEEYRFEESILEHSRSNSLEVGRQLDHQLTDEEVDILDYVRIIQTKKLLDYNISNLLADSEQVLRELDGALDGLKREGYAYYHQSHEFPKRAWLHLIEQADVNLTIFDDSNEDLVNLREDIFLIGSQLKL